MTYTTGTLTPAQAAIFGRLYDEKVGTECQTDGSDEQRVITCFELTREEASKCRKIEEMVTDRY